jgi:hypothetical protein
MLKRCSKCQESFECKESNACWCNRIEYVSIIILNNNNNNNNNNNRVDCFCKNCLLENISKSNI